MLVDTALPFPDGVIFLGAALLVAGVALGTFVLWRRDLRAARDPAHAVPQPVSETDASPRHCIGPAARPSGSNLTGSGSRDHGVIASRLWATVAEVARVLPQHAFRVEVLADLRGLSVEEPSFSLALAGLLLHAAQIGRSHFIELAWVAPEHPLYQRGSSPQVLVHVLTEAEQPAPLPHLAESAVACCRLADGHGSVEQDTCLWLLWPTKRLPAPPAAVASSTPQPAAPVCA